MLDGVMENFTAALLEPYADPHEQGGCRHELGSGRLFVEPEVVEAAVAMLAAEGFQVHFHAIGDRAVRLALDAVEHADAGAPVGAGAHDGEAPGGGPAGAGADLRHHVAHIQLVHPDDVPRFGRLGVVANAQPFWACNEPQMTELTIPFLGPARSEWQYPFGGLVQSGAVLAGGSDWPVSTADPLEEIAVAVARMLPDAAREDRAETPFLPDQRLALSSALGAFTAGSAYVNHLDRDTGTVEPGKLADLAVLDGDPFALDPDHLPEARVCCTLVGGQVAFEPGAV
jgi:predicted amidohydrolase YtcJ